MTRLLDTLNTVFREYCQVYPVAHVADKKIASILVRGAQQTELLTTEIVREKWDDKLYNLLEKIMSFEFVRFVSPPPWIVHGKMTISFIRYTDHVNENVLLSRISRNKKRRCNCRASNPYEKKKKV